ncbi:MAG: ATP synthase F0 subunit C [Candidatus Babeliales bacterium]
MEQYAYFLHFISIGLVVALTSIGVGIGAGFTGQATVRNLYRQPGAATDLYKASFISLALVETSGIFSIVMAFILLFNKEVPNFFGSIGTLGIAFGLGIAGFVTGIYSSLPAQAAFKAIARQPFFAPRIINLMVIAQSLIQTPVIFGLIVSLLISASISSAQMLAEGTQLLAAGLCIGLGSIGPTIGLGRFTYEACYTAGINRSAYGKIVPFTLISGAIIETPLIFTLIVALLVTQTTFENSFVEIVIPFMAALCMGLGALGAGLASSRTATAACIGIGKDPHATSLISKASLVAQALIDAIAIYALLIALLMIFLR